MSEALVQELQADNQQIAGLREQLRSKNNNVRELARQVESLGGVPVLRPGSTSNSPVRADNKSPSGKHVKDRLQVCVDFYLQRAVSLHGGSDSCPTTRLKAVM